MNDIKLTQADANSIARGKPKLPTIPTSFGTDPKTMLTAIKEILEVREGQRGSPLDKAVTFRDLFEQGIVALNIDGNAFVNKPGGSVVPPPSNGGTIDQTPPPAATGLRADGALASIIVTWDKPVYGAHSHTEVWSSATDDIGTATLVGTSPSQIYVDVVGTGSVRYYWIKWVSKFPVTGPFNKTSGTRGETGYDAQYLINVLSANPPPGGTYNPLLYVQNDPNLVVDGVPIPVGTYMTAAYIANASITRAKIGLLAVDDARIASLHAAKITAGDIDADRMKANIVQAVQGQFVSLSAISAWLGNVTIGQYGWLKTDGVWDYMGGVGIYMGWHTDQYKFRVGDPGGDHLRFENGKLTIVGDLYSTGSGTFRGTFIAGNAESLHPVGGQNGLYAGADGFFVGDGWNPLTGIPGGSAFIKMNRGEKRIELLAENMSITCGWPSSRFALQNDGNAMFRDVTVRKLTITGGDDSHNTYEISRTAFGTTSGAGQLQFNVPQNSFCQLWIGLTSGTIENIYASVSNAPHDYTTITTGAVYPGKGPTFAKIYQGGHETGGAGSTRDAQFSFGYLIAGTYYLNIAVDNNGFEGGTAIARVMLTPSY